jgi:microsomal epoxide hydrolase
MEKTQVTPEVRPFVIEVPDDVLTDLKARLNRTRFPALVDTQTWDAGTSAEYLVEFCRYWRDEYDWRSAEAALNALPQYETVIDGQKLHFVHARSPEPNARPLLILNGWPSSFAEFYKVVAPLTDPVAHGADAADAFHVVCPSLPGYGFSSPLASSGWNTGRMAEAFDSLMSLLGYESYGVQAGDIGALAAVNLALRAEDHLSGLHLHLAPASPPEGEGVIGQAAGADLSGLSEDDLAGLARLAEYWEWGSGYTQIQSTRPQSLGFALNDSPAGLAGWVLEKYREWSDCGGDLEAAFGRDELVTNLMIYWVSGAIESTLLSYREERLTGRFGLPPERRVEVPTGVSVYPADQARVPRPWVEHYYNLVYWDRPSRGGHFPALEQPQLYLDQVRRFFRTPGVG